MAELFKVGDIVLWKIPNDSFDWTRTTLGLGPFRIIASASSTMPNYHMVNADGTPLLDDEVADGPRGRRYYVAAEYEIRKDVFLSAVAAAAGLSTPNRSVKEIQE